MRGEGEVGGMEEQSPAGDNTTDTFIVKNCTENEKIGQSSSSEDGEEETGGRVVEVIRWWLLALCLW